ncbi:transglycosylase family protein [Streptomyces sp. NPDC093546]|uniref:transglycosylase family protein n=1 Tax=Streptomyces sp. NPDC093546 TaxID=3366040 RepID=UPI00382FD008
MTGSAIALPLLGAGSASAVDAHTWDRVAECESGGAWSADMGNGFYGGLQLSQETWDAYGGKQYALRPDLASRAQQIAVAEQVYAATGVKAWETCAPIVGLGGATGAKPDAEPGATPGASSGTATPEATPDAAPDASAPADAGQPVEPTEPVAPADPVESLLPTEPAEPAAPTTPGAAPETAAPAAPPVPGKGKHRGAPDPAEPSAESPAATDPTATDPAAPEAGNPTSTDNSVSGRETDGRTSRGDGATRDLADAQPGTYTVRPGDSLSAIAAAKDLEGGWTALYDANRQTVGADPDLILPGQSLDLAPAQR